MIQLDVQTLVVAVIVLCIAISAPLAAITRRRRGTGAMWNWSLSLFVFVLGSLLLVLREIVPPLISVMAGNALVICAFVFLGRAASSMTTRFLDGTHRWFFAVLSAPVLGLLYLAVDSIWPRIAYMAAVECYLAGQLATQLRESRVDSGTARQTPLFAFEILVWILFAEAAVRTVTTVALASEGTFFEQTPVAISFLAAIPLAAVGTCVLVWHELAVRDETITRSIDVASGLPNEAVFLQLVKGRLASVSAANGASIALVRAKLSSEGGFALRAEDRAMISRKLGTRIDGFLDHSDVLARLDDCEFGILFRGGDTSRAVRSLENALRNVEARALVGVRGEYFVSATAALAACDSSSGDAEQLIRGLRSELQNMAGGVRVVDQAFGEESRRASGSDRG